jgi:two-component system, OmpR family, response regulator
MADGKGHVLVVDDEPDIVEFLSTVLRDEGYSVEIARDGVEAVERVRDGRPSIVILDLMMPRMTGFEVLDVLRAKPPTPRPSVIVLSAKSTHQDILTALEKGADDFIPKPFDLEDLLLRVRVWSERSREYRDSPLTLKIFTLSPFRVHAGEELILDEDTGDAHTRTLIKYLVTEHDQPVQRAQLLYLLWPDLDEEAAGAHLTDLLDRLRRSLHPTLRKQELIIDNGNFVKLNAEADIWVDAAEFESNVHMAQDAQEAGDVDIALGLFLSALALYKEDYLRENLYEDWPSDRREKLREQWISALFRVSAICADRCEYADSVRLMKKVLEIDPYRENAYQALMLYLSRAGRRGEAIQLYRYAERLFAQHLAAQPAPSTRMLYEKILRGEAG